MCAGHLTDYVHGDPIREGHLRVFAGIYHQFGPVLRSALQDSLAVADQHSGLLPL